MSSLIFEFITSHGILSEEHTQELKSKRGFSDQTIKDLRLFSGGDYLLKFEQKMITQFGEDALRESGTFYFPQGSMKLQMSTQILDKRVIIPYLNAGGQAFFIRPHKLGLPIPIEIYCPKHPLDRAVILTESEFKAAAAYQLGFSAIGIPGISSFSEEHFPRLVKVLNDGKVRDICIIFDNEIKDDPKFPNYKENPVDRHDTAFYAQYMAKRLDREGFRTHIGTLPDSWRVNGKADIDSALALGKTREDLSGVVAYAQPWKQYIEDLPREAQEIIQRKMKRKYFKSHVRVEFGRYVALRHRGKIEVDEIISNFVIKIVATNETSEGIIRDMIFINEFKETSRSFSVNAEAMASSDCFATFCLNKGNFLWRGNKEDLMNVWEPEFLEDDGRHIIEPDHLGWIEEEKMWLFGNVAIRLEQELRPDKNHVFWGEKRGIRPIPLGVTSGKMMVSEGVPHLCLTEDKSCNLVGLRGKFDDILGDKQSAMCLGWVFAVPFLEDVFDLYGCFPFLFVTGRRGSGKSTVAEWLMNFFGLENAGKMASDTTPVGMQRYLAYYSSLPVFIDEYRNTKNITYKNGFLRNVYNRQSAGKGIKADYGVREAKIRGTLIMSGEETPEDNALLTRCIPIVVSEKHRKINHFNWFMVNKIKFSYHIYKLLLNKKNLVKGFIKEINDGKDYLVSTGLDDRTAINYAIVAAGYHAAFGENLDFAQWIVKEASRVRIEYQSEQAVDVFLDDLMAMSISRDIDAHYYDVEDGKIYLYFHGMYTQWAQYYRKARGIEPFKASAIRDYLKEEPGFVDVDFNRRIKGRMCRCIVFMEDEAPDQIKSLIEAHPEEHKDV